LAREVLLRAAEEVFRERGAVLLRRVDFLAVARARPLDVFVFAFPFWRRFFITVRAATSSARFPYLPERLALFLIFSY
jgi:hypothetical protein